MDAITLTKHLSLLFACMDAEYPGSRTTFEYVVIVDTIGFLDDTQKTLPSLGTAIIPQTRITIMFHNFLWQPILQLAEKKHMQMALVKQLPYKRDSPAEVFALRLLIAYALIRQVATTG